MAKTEIIISRGEQTRQWRITGLWVKLSLKYGVIEKPWGEAPNASTAFDRYALTRGPGNGPPTVADLAVTTLMNSNVTRADLALVSDWLLTPNHRATVAETTRLLQRCNSLADMPKSTLEAVGSLMSQIEELHGIKTAKVAKWFAAWAPAHVPMIDQYVGDALVYPPEKLANASWATLLARFKTILENNLPVLESLGKRLAKEVALPDAVPAARVLDNLIWFDWACENYAQDFADWVRPRDDSAGEHVLTSKAIEYDEDQTGDSGLARN
jgi:Family of unknown function (DUF6308)